ncbi:MAG: PKD domain-containing protein, partial [Actinomycetales bacterium]|nr:PKD domain-containing protein [Actinomycetales bacterium]
GLAGFELFPRDGAVFYNDPASQRAGVILVDGSVKPVLKYDPADPSQGVLAQPGEGVEVSDRTGSGPALPRPVRTTPTGTEEAARVNPGDLVVQVSTTPGVAGTPVGLRVSARQGRVTTATWSFGDRTPQVNGVEVSHTWVVPGSYRVSVRARLDNGRTGFRDVVMPVLAAPTATTTPTAPAPAPAPAPASTRTTTTTTTTTRADARPVASLSVSPRSVTVGDRVTANATRSRDDGTSLSYRIAWGDSSTSRPTNGTASHRYEKTGTYTVTLTVTDSARQRDTDTATVTVGEPPVWAGGHGKCYHGGAMDIDNDGTTDWSLGEDGLTLRGPGGFTAFAASQSDHSSSYTDCESASYERTSYTLEEHQWLRICLMTSGGRMSSVTVVQVPEDYYETMVEYDYVVW